MYEDKQNVRKQYVSGQCFFIIYFGKNVEFFRTEALCGRGNTYVSNFYTVFVFRMEMKRII